VELLAMMVNKQRLYTGYYISTAIQEVYELQGEVKELIKHLR
jgi:hypothetical protein